VLSRLFVELQINTAVVDPRVEQRILERELDRFGST
jgi:hypothetical protein